LAAVAVEHDLADAGSLGLLAEGLAERRGAGDVRLELLVAQLLAKGGDENQGRALLVVDRLRVDVLVAEVDAEARAGGVAHHFLADAPAALLSQLGFLLEIHLLGSLWIVACGSDRTRA